MKNTDLKNVSGRSPVPRGKRAWTALFCLLLVFCTSEIFAQSRINISGTVVDEQGDPIYGAAVVLKEDLSIGASTDGDGRFTLSVPRTGTLEVSYVGKETQEIPIEGRTTFPGIVLREGSIEIETAVVVGFGEQPKASVLGAITQTTGKELERAGGVSSLGMALTGNLPGVVTITSTGLPGEEDPKILIRAATSWNNSDPLVLVDGIERSISSVDINSVDNISVLKDASATAVFGVKGANGVLLITTKRGREGRAQIDVGFSSTMKTISRLPDKMDAYDAFKLKNDIVEYELATNPDVWGYITPQAVIDKFRNQTTQDQREQYPNIDWVDYMFNDFAMSYNANLNISGGTSFVKYFASADYLHEGDMFKTFSSDRGYTSNFAFDRINTRTNLDFSLFKTTTLRVNLFGSYGVRASPWGFSNRDIGNAIAGAYYLPADAFYPRYSDGMWGYDPESEVNTPNPVQLLANTGQRYNTTTRITTDFLLMQDLNFLLKGLKARAGLSVDNSFSEGGRGVSDGREVAMKYIDPITGVPTYKYSTDGTTSFDWAEIVGFSAQAGSMSGGGSRSINYSFQVDWVNSFNRHNLTAMGRVARDERASGANIPNYREDWVFRTTYDFDRRYFIEFNGAYNGSERFSKENRFAFFASGALGWMISEEKFMEKVNFVDMLKLRGSFGQIGDDNISGRWLYMDEWARGNTAIIQGLYNERSPAIFTWYRQTKLGNPNVHWETVTKQNIGIDFALFDGLLSGSAEYFHDDRKDILIGSRSVPSYFGVAAPTANLGRVIAQGYEVELRFSKRVGQNIRLWANASVAHSRNEILERDDPALYPSYLKQAGYTTDQNRTHISNGFYNTMDELYGSTPFSTSDSKIPGGLYVVDFDGDGVIDTNYDRVPLAYSSAPQNTFSTVLGLDWKGLNLFLQFYGVTNVSRTVGLNSMDFPNRNTAYDVGSFWSKDNPNADLVMPRLVTAPNGDYRADQWLYDGSYVRLKNAEIAYTFQGSNSPALQRLGIGSLRVYLNGNNLWFWSRLPDDRESNFSGNSAYPTVKRFNLGIKVTL